MSNQHQVEEMISIYKQRLNMLQQRMAQYGAETPPHMLMEIENLNAQVVELQRQSESYTNLPARIVPIEIIERIDNVNDNISRLESQVASITTNTSTMQTNNVSHHYELNEYLTLRSTNVHIKHLCDTYYTCGAA